LHVNLCRVDPEALIPLSFPKVFETLGFVVQQGAALSDTIPSASAEDVYFVFPSEANVSFLDTAREMFTEFHALVAAGNSPAALLLVYPTAIFVMTAMHKVFSISYDALQQKP
jgi:hypothetical protein